MSSLSHATKIAVLGLWQDDVPITQIAVQCGLCVPTVRKLAKEAGLFPRKSDAERKSTGFCFAASEITEDEVERRKLEVQARWTDSDRRLRDCYRGQRRVRLRAFQFNGTSMVEVAR